MIDNDERKLNVIISGVTENDIITKNDSDENITLKSDSEKISWLFYNLCGREISDLDEPGQDIEIQRIGKVREGFSRMLKVKMRSISNRDDLLKNASKLKDYTGVWKKVFIKKDLHPVYIAENKRLLTTLTTV